MENDFIDFLKDFLDYMSLKEWANREEYRSLAKVFLENYDKAVVVTDEIIEETK